MDFIDKSLRDFLADVSSDSPAPGGGSVAAYVAAMGLALLKKTLIFTFNKTGDEDVRRQLVDILKEADNLANEFLEMVNKDAEVFVACMRDKSSPPEKRFAPSRQVAQDICDLCHKAFKIHAKGSYLYSRSMKLDYEAAQRLIDAAFRISWENAHYGEED